MAMVEHREPGVGRVSRQWRGQSVPRNNAFSRPEGSVVAGCLLGDPGSVAGAIAAVSSAAALTFPSGAGRAARLETLTVRVLWPVVRRQEFGTGRHRPAPRRGEFTRAAFMD